MTLIGAFLLFAGFGRFGYGRDRLWDLGRHTDWILVALAALGFAFTWWARLYLGRLWSSSVTKKADHHVVETGPYAIVRHPIYTGLIAAAFATAGLKGTPVGVAGAVLMTLGFWIKARLEERFLREQLGRDAYDSYRRRAPMLMPFGPKSAWRRAQPTTNVRARHRSEHRKSEMPRRFARQEPTGSRRAFFVRVPCSAESVGLPASLTNRACGF